MVKTLTPEEIEALQKSPHVLYVRSGMVYFTREFKAILYRRMLEGHTVRSTLRENGIDPQWLGDRRIWDLAERLRKEARSPGGEDLLAPPRKKSAIAREQELTKQVDRLQTELAYLRQEVDFLKRLRAEDQEAQKKWKAKHRQE